MVNKQLAPEQVAEILDCSVTTIRAMLRDGLLSGKKVRGQWRVEISEVRQLQTKRYTAEPPRPSASSPTEVDPGMIEASIALAGIAAAIAAILPSLPGASETFRLFVAILAGILAVFSAYSALRLLAYHRIGDKSMSGLKEMWTLLTHPNEAKPYWFMALALVVWLILSMLIGVLALMR